MIDRNKPFAQLVDKARQQPESGGQSFWQEMMPQVERMVRRVVRWGPGSSTLEQKIGQELHQAAALDAGRDPEHVIGVVARRLCREMYERLREPAPAARPWLQTRECGGDRHFATIGTSPEVALSA